MYSQESQEIRDGKEEVEGKKECRKRWEGKLGGGTEMTGAKEEVKKKINQQMMQCALVRVPATGRYDTGAPPVAALYTSPNFPVLTAQNVLGKVFAISHVVLI